MPLLSFNFLLGLPPITTTLTQNIWLLFHRLQELQHDHGDTLQHKKLLTIKVKVLTEI